MQWLSPQSESRIAAPGNLMQAARTILIVDGNVALRRSLAEQLELHAEFASRECDSGAAALHLARQEAFDAVLLGDALADLDSHELCRLLRQAALLSYDRLRARDRQSDK